MQSSPMVVEMLLMALASSSPTAAAAGGPPSTLPPGAVLRRSPVGNVSKPVPVFTFGEEGYPVFREPVVLLLPSGHLLAFIEGGQNHLASR